MFISLNINQSIYASLLIHFILCFFGSLPNRLPPTEHPIFLRPFHPVFRIFFFFILNKQFVHFHFYFFCLFCNHSRTKENNFVKIIFLLFFIIIFHFPSFFLFIPTFFVTTEKYLHFLYFQELPTADPNPQKKLKDCCRRSAVK